MYEAFYGFREDPFRISPDYRFSYPHKTYIKARNYLEYGLLRGEGIVVITGEPGTGKSTVINDLLSDYDSQDLVVAKLVTTQLRLEDLLRMMAFSFGVDALGMDKATILVRLEEMLIQWYQMGRRALLIIDEAQNLTEKTLEELRLLSNFQKNEQPLLQIFLIGQPPLKDLVLSPQMEQLRQRLVAACHFEALDINETHDYITHRLRIAGWNSDPSLSDDAFRFIHYFSAGIPRRINLICSRLLLHGHVEELHHLNGHDVQQVVGELPLEMAAPEVEIARPQPQDISTAHQTHKILSGNNNRDSMFRYEDSVTLKSAKPGRRDPQQEIRASDPAATDTLSSSLSQNDNYTESHPLSSTAIRSEETRPRLKKKIPTGTVPSHDLSSGLRGIRSENNASASPQATAVNEKKNRPTVPGSSVPPVHTRVRHPPPRRRLLTRLIAAIFIFASVFGGIYTYLAPHQDQLEYSTGTSFESDNALEKLKEAQTNSLPSLTGDSPSYNYSQKESSADLLSSTMELDTLLPGPEEPSDRLQPINIDNETNQSMDTEGALQDDSSDTSPTTLKQNNQDISLSLSNQIINEVIGDIPDMDVTALGDKSEGPTSTPADKQRAPIPVSPNKTSNKRTDPGVESIRGRNVINRNLENALRHYASSVERLADGSLKITLGNDISFVPSSTQFKQPATGSTLDKLAFVLRNYGGFTVQVVASAQNGHLESGGGADLSQLRAQTIAKYLIRHGIPANRIRSAGSVSNTTTLDPNAGTSRSKSESEVVELFLRPSA
jgi:putative secretion ATPase (PEP-CTERM system associated)